jgi:uncharacterized protein involved in exopolysaccharide biosynthesis
MDENHEKQARATNADEIDFRELLRLWWARKWVIAGAAIAAAAISVVVVLLLPNVYRAEALLAPNSQEQGAGLAGMGLAAQYGGLASLAGIDLGAGESDKTALGLEILKSRKFVTEFIERRNILVPLMAAKRWDPVSRELKIDAGEYDVQSEAWVRKVRPPKTTVPSSQEAYEEFMEILSINQDEDTGFVRIAIEHYSPEMARDWVGWLVEDLNATVMNQDVTEAQHAIDYLREQIERTSLAELKSVLFSLIEEQIKTVMLAEVSKEYLLKTIDPAVAPEEKARPNRLLIVIIGLVLGGLVGLLIVSASTLSGAMRAAKTGT